MSAFDDLVDEYVGGSDAIGDIRAVVRKLYFYDFIDAPIRLWQGQGKLFTQDGNEWLGSVDAMGADHHQASSIQDGRDGSSGTYNFGFMVNDIPGKTAFELYEGLKEDQWRVTGRSLTIYLAVFQPGEALRPETPIKFFKELTMIQPKFSEKIEADNDQKLIRTYKASITAKDANFGRSNKPNGTYADTIQKRRAAELGVALDRGCEFLASLANKTFIVP